MKNGKKKKKLASKSQTSRSSKKQPQTAKTTLAELFGSLKVFRYNPSEKDDSLPVYAGGPDGTNGFGPYGDS